MSTSLGQLGADRAGKGSTSRFAVVTGASRGLGAEVVRRLLAEGWKVAGLSRSSSPFIEEAAAGHPDAFWWHSLDLGNPAEVRAPIREAYRRFGPVDLLLNNAGVTHEELLLTTPTSVMESLVTTNLVGAMAVAQACARLMIGRGGVIVNVSSVNAVRGVRGVSAYAASKAGLDGFTRALARELGPLNIRVNSVVPGYFDSDMTARMPPEARERIRRRTPLGRLANVAEIADVALFLASPAAAFVTGQSLVVDGGFTC
ncbi:SDR family NAD(P)-dependent oxidoreductase [Plantactinospora sp. KLBMP9567]|uniref:SDR family NAD(P)-dependent oxidoreductase n=1 Tax=Plantactinospora sp. KLBMP9567 TaxID=3085900 RepID=UPI002981DCA2|nr:SDR family oxidoreductase [Plantactinospora sp. KLBMP9567]MDW5329231.1 SDR family oxidoreductase [Plantactinospora sp. KLBMP9567]